MATLIYSERCIHSMDILTYINSTPALKSMVKFHNVNKQGVPSKSIKAVPTLVTPENKILVGAEVKQWLTSMLPCNFNEFDGAGIGMANLDNTEKDDDFFALDSYGVSLKPNITAELQARIDANVGDTFASIEKPK